MQKPSGTRGDRGRRRDRLVEPHDHDPYRAHEGLSDPTGCSECGASYRKGRWTWQPAPAAAPRTQCPACRRIQDDYPAGYLELEGEFVADHADEIRGLVRNVEERERREHPLKRVMAIRPIESGLRVTTTDVHLADAIGRALHRAYEGELRSDWSEGETLVRASWRR